MYTSPARSIQQRGDMNHSDICVYLAGPMTGCNENQKTHWRREMARTLKKLGYKVSDPTEATALKGAYAVTQDIAQSDVVVANLWKESIGTVLGIVQARRANIPVILIDRNYIDSPVLLELVDQTVRDETAAVNALGDLVDRHFRMVCVKKKNDDKPHAFKSEKLNNSIRAALFQTGCDDTVLISALLKQINREVLRCAKQADNTITTRQIKQIIFDSLCAFTTAHEGIHAAEAALLLRNKWGDFELKKGDNEAYDALARLLDEANEARDMARLECENLRSIADAGRTSFNLAAAAEPAAPAIKLTLKDADSLQQLLHATDSGRDSVVVRTSARRSFRDLPYANAERMETALLLLRDCLLPSKLGADQAARYAAWDRFKEGLQQHRLKYGLSSTQTGRGLHSEQHTVKTADGRTLICEKIRDIGRTHDRQDFLCIYFCWDALEQKLHIKGFDHGETVNDHT